MALYTLFSTYGPVLDVVVLKTKKMRGQAHIVYRDIQASTQAMRALQGFDFFGKELNIVYAKGSSHVIAKLRGTYMATATANATAGVSTDLQKSIFGAPPSAVTAATIGTKRPREEESDEGEAPMDEDESDVSMEASSDED
jgi:RNA recognition motif-containing protein